MKYKGPLHFAFVEELRLTRNSYALDVATMSERKRVRSGPAFENIALEQRFLTSRLPLTSIESLN